RPQYPHSHSSIKAEIGRDAETPAPQDCACRDCGWPGDIESIDGVNEIICGRGKDDTELVAGIGSVCDLHAIDVQRCGVEMWRVGGATDGHCNQERRGPPTGPTLDRTT